MSLISTGSNVEHIVCIKSELNAIPIIQGQLIYVSDNQELYWDINSTTRKQVTNIIILDTIVEFNNLLTPLIKFYYIKESNKLYYYTGTQWILINNSGDTEGYSITWGTLNIDNIWTAQTGYFEKIITISGSSNRTQVNLMPDNTVIEHLISVKCSGMYIENRDGTLYAIAVGNKPTNALSIDYNAYNVGNSLTNFSNGIVDITYDNSVGNLYILDRNDIGTNIPLSGVVYNANYYSSNRTVVLPIVNSTNVQFTIPEDQSSTINAISNNVSNNTNSISNLSNAIANVGNTSFTTKLDWTMVGDDYIYTTQKTNTNPITWVEIAKKNNAIYATKTLVKVSNYDWTITYECPSENINATFKISNENGLWIESRKT